MNLSIFTFLCRWILLCALMYVEAVSWDICSVVVISVQLEVAVFCCYRDLLAKTGWMPTVIVTTMHIICWQCFQCYQMVLQTHCEWFDIFTNVDSHKIINFVKETHYLCQGDYVFARCLSVCLLATSLSKNYWSDLRDNYVMTRKFQLHFENYPDLDSLTGFALAEVYAL